MLIQLICTRGVAEQSDTTLLHVVIIRMTHALILHVNTTQANIAFTCTKGLTSSAYSGDADS